MRPILYDRLLSSGQGQTTTQGGGYAYSNDADSCTAARSTETVQHFSCLTSLPRWTSKVTHVGQIDRFPPDDLDLSGQIHS